MTGEIKDDVTKKYFQTFWYFWFKVLQSDEKRYLEFSQERLRKKIRNANLKIWVIQRWRVHVANVHFEKSSFFI